MTQLHHSASTATGGGGAAPASPSVRGRATPLPSTPGAEPRSPMANTRMPRNASAPAVVPPPPPSPAGSAFAAQLLPGGPPPLRPLSWGMPASSLTRSLQRAAADGRTTWISRQGSGMHSQAPSPHQSSPAASLPPSRRNSLEADDQPAKPSMASAALSVVAAGAEAAASSFYSPSKGAPPDDGAAIAVEGPGRLLQPPAVPERKHADRELFPSGLPAATPTVTWFAPVQTPLPVPFSVAAASSSTPSAASPQLPSDRATGSSRRPIPLAFLTPAAAGTPGSPAGPAACGIAPNGASGAGGTAVPGSSFSNASNTLTSPQGALLTDTLLSSETLPRRSAGTTLSTNRSRRMLFIQGWDSSRNLTLSGGPTAAATMAAAAAAADAADGRRSAAGMMGGLGAGVASAFRGAKQLAAKLAGRGNRGGGRHSAQSEAGGSVARTSQPTPSEGSANGHAVSDVGVTANGSTGQQHMSGGFRRTSHPQPTRPPNGSLKPQAPLFALLESAQQPSPGEQHGPAGRHGSGAGRGIQGSSAGAAACGPTGITRRFAEPSIIGSAVPDIAGSVLPADDASADPGNNGRSPHDPAAVNDCPGRSSAPAADRVNGTGRRSMAAPIASAGGWQPFSFSAAEPWRGGAFTGSPHGQPVDLHGRSPAAAAATAAAAHALDTVTEVDTSLGSGTEHGGEGDVDVHVAAEAAVEQQAPPQSCPEPAPPDQPLVASNAVATSVRAAAAHAALAQRLMKGTVVAHGESLVTSCSLAFDAAAISPVDTPTLSREHSVTRAGRGQGGAAGAGPPASSWAPGGLSAAPPGARNHLDLILANGRPDLESGTAAIPTIGDYVTPADGKGPSVPQLLLGRAQAASAVAFVGSYTAGSSRAPHPGGSKRSSATISLGCGSRGTLPHNVGSSAGSSRRSASQLLPLSPMCLSGAGGTGGFGLPVPQIAAAVHWCYSQLALGAGDSGAPRAGSGMVPAAFSTGSSNAVEHLAGLAAATAASVRGGPGGERVGSLSHLIPAAGSGQYYLTPQQLLLMGSGGSGSTAGSAGGPVVLHASTCSADASQGHPAGATGAATDGPARDSARASRFHLITTTFSDVAYTLDSGRGAAMADAAAEGTADYTGAMAIADASMCVTAEQRAQAGADVYDSSSSKGAGSAGSAGSLRISLQSQLARQARSGLTSCGGLPTAGDCIVTLGGGMCEPGAAAILVAAGALGSLGASASGEGDGDVNSFELVLGLQPVRLPLGAASVNTAPRLVLGPGPAATGSPVPEAAAAETRAAAEHETGMQSPGAVASTAAAPPV